MSVQNSKNRSGCCSGGNARRFATSARAKNVSASFSDQILRGAILALIVSFLLITIYVAFRFEWRFAVPILRTIVNGRADTAMPAFQREGADGLTDEDILDLLAHVRTLGSK